MKIVCNGFVSESLFWLKNIVDGHVIEMSLFNRNVLIINNLYYDGYVIERPFEPKIVCNGYVTESTKKVFDGYLTGQASYPQLQAWPYLTGTRDENGEKRLNPCVSAPSLFDGYLTVSQ